MEENHSDLMLPDITEAESNDVENDHENGVQQQQVGARATRLLTATTEGGTVVQVSVPVESLIGNVPYVITQPQYNLRVDSNGFISSNMMGDVGADIKTHYVIQQQAPTESVASISDAPQEIAQMNAESLTDHAMSEVLPIRCKDTNAEMHRSRFGSGGRGRCIRFKDEWLTPSEFERRCGRGSSKDWKRSIKSGGVDIQTLINGNVLKPHANSCSCSICCDDPKSTGPVRYFKAYKRRRPNQSGGFDTSPGQPKSKKPVIVADGSEQEQYIVTKEEGGSMEDESNFADTDAADFDNRLNTLLKKLVDVQDVVTQVTEEIKTLRNDYARANANDDDQNISINTKRCINCNRVARAECSLCRRTPYCRTYCQRRDWNAHQVECMRDQAENNQMVMLSDHMVLLNEQA